MSTSGAWPSAHTWLRTPTLCCLPHGAVCTFQTPPPPPPESGSPLPRGAILITFHICLEGFVNRSLKFSLLRNLFCVPSCCYSLSFLLLSMLNNSSFPKPFAPFAARGGYMGRTNTNKEISLWEVLNNHIVGAITAIQSTSIFTSTFWM